MIRLLLICSICCFKAHAEGIDPISEVFFGYFGVTDPTERTEVNLDSVYQELPIGSDFNRIIDFVENKNASYPFKPIYSLMSSFTDSTKSYLSLYFVFPLRESYFSWVCVFEIKDGLFRSISAHYMLIPPMSVNCLKKEIGNYHLSVEDLKMSWNELDERLKGTCIESNLSEQPAIHD